MNRIDRCFEQLRSDGRTALITYIAAADPSPGDTVRLMGALAEGGADILELGVPFSDPMADGPVIQAACERALKNGATPESVLGMVSDFREHDTVTPVVLMGYLNPVEAFGAREFINRASHAGVDGIIVVDLPPEEVRLAGMFEHLDQEDIMPIFLLSPTTSDARVRFICSCARGFVYYVSLKGTTGADHFDDSGVAERLGLIRRHTTLPIAIGFGIKDSASAAAAARHADAVVVGSALVAAIARSVPSGDCLMAALDFLRPIRAAIDAGVSLKSPAA